MITGYQTKNFIWERFDNISYQNSTHLSYTLTAKKYIHYFNESKQVFDLGPDGYFKFTVMEVYNTTRNDIAMLRIASNT